MQPRERQVTGHVMSLEEAEEFVASRRWQFAKSMPQWPHEYTIREWAPGRGEEFDSFLLLILAEGVVKPWPSARRPRYHHHYLRLGEHDYWFMETLQPFLVPPGPTVINRATPWEPT